MAFLSGGSGWCVAYLQCSSGVVIASCRQYPGFRFYLKPLRTRLVPVSVSGAVTAQRIAVMLFNNPSGVCMCGKTTPPVPVPAALAEPSVAAYK